MDYTKLLKNFVAKKNSVREQLKRPWIKEKAIIATNQYILAKIENETEINTDTPGDFPDVDQIIRIDEEKDIEIILDIEYLYAIAKLYKDLNAKNKGLRRVKMYIRRQEYKTPVTFYQKLTKTTAMIMPCIE